MEQHRRSLWLGAALVLLLVGYGVAPILRAVSVAHPMRSNIGKPTALVDAGLQVREVSFQTARGATIRGWYVPSQNGAAVMVAHGLGENRSAHVPIASALAKQGYGVLLVDLIAHGESDGSTLALDGQEILAAVSFLKNQGDNTPNKIGVLGYSLGALVSLQAAAQTQDIQAIVADGPMPVITLQDQPPPLDVSDWAWVPFDAIQLQALAVQGAAPAFSTIDAMHHTAPRPLLFIAGTRNQGEARVIRNYYANENRGVTLWEIAYAGHIGGYAANPQEYETRVTAFFDKALLP